MEYTRARAIGKNTIVEVQTELGQQKFCEKITQQQHQKQPPNKTKSENICSTAENIAFFEFFFCCQQTFNKFISQQKHHSAELSTPRLFFSLSLSFFFLVSFFLFYL